MRDLARAPARFPEYAALRHTLHSPATGAAVEAPTAAATAARTLAEDVVDMPLFAPVRVDRVVAGVREACGAARP
ncbi:uncharacterized protein PHACADRAFT_260368 [Phanerochaete carnosa HHB-10118-sp]|uniref:Uncharacterized protein n=1 Tax=Phanerochaete carnosa (strain HHB-10118-sp) TaxID=650164 RepID=K5UV24_PHACS|nr:uncharacterized protein PHACADRAFT_260368 [Phanerochaete carnosa HHB-10118-sp]EKM53826.1 hypothetical protein PHACADRAFT_260368 [Phanerochaete carnosa HHB-10118-sp]